MFTLLPAKDVPGIINIGKPIPGLIAEIDNQTPFIVEPIAPGGRGFTGPLSDPNNLLEWHLLPKKKVCLNLKKLKQLKKKKKEQKLILVN